MKNFLTLLLFGLSLQTMAQTSGYSTDTKFEFPFQAGDSIWATYSSTQERISALQIPEGTLKSIPTDELLDVCLDFPYIHHVFLYDSEEAGFSALRKMFNGYDELLKRDNCADAIEIKCTEYLQQIETVLGETPQKQCDYSFKSYLLFYLSGNEEVVKTIDSSQATNIIYLINEIAKKMENHAEIFGIAYNMALKQSSGLIAPYKNTTRTTPNGYSVAVEENSEALSNTQKESIKNDIKRDYPNVEILDEPTSTYNCHAYAWHICDGHPKDYVWMNNPSKYWETGAYYEVPEYEADVVFYYSTSQTDHVNDISWHSAISINDNEYISKWGAWALIKHELMDVPEGYGKRLKYYKKYEPKFSYPANSVVSTSSTFSIDFVPEDYAITWKLADDYYAQNCMTISADGKTCTITRAPERDMDKAMLSVQLTYNGYHVKTFGRNLYAHNGFKGRYMTTGNWENMTYPYIIYVPAGKFISIESGNIVDATVTYEGDIIPSNFQYYNSDGLINLSIPQDTQGSAIVIHATCKDGNKYDFIVLKKSTYSLSTRMDGQQLEITLDNDAIEMPMLALAEQSFDDTSIGSHTEWTVSIFNAITNQNMFSCNTLDSVIVDTSNWPQGVYIIRATNVDDVLTEKIVVK